MRRTVAGDITPTGQRRDRSNARNPSPDAGDREPRRTREPVEPARIPKGGEHRPHAGRMWRRFTVPAAHRATTAVLGGAYPFLADASPTVGVLIGTDTITGAPFCYDPWQLYAEQTVANTNILIAGNIGWGKTNTAMAIALRNIAAGRRVIVPGDPKDDWTRLADAVGGQSIRLGPGLPGRLNPLDPGAMPPGADPDTWRRQTDQRRAGLLTALVETAAPALAPLHPETLQALQAALAAACHRTETPTLPHVVAALQHPDLDDADSDPRRIIDAARPARAALAQLCTGPLAGLLDGPATITIDPSLPMITIGTGALGDDDLAHSLVMLAASTWIGAALADPTYGQRIVIYDEAWRILSTPAQLARINTELRLSRARGTATILITHALSDVDKTGDSGTAIAATARGLLALCDTRVVFRQAPGELDRTSAELALTGAERDIVAALGKGEALWKTGALGHRVRTDLCPTQATLFNTDQRMTSAEPS